jgi:hypothetical protein
MMDLAGRRCVAIAYTWKFAATLIEEFHALLTVSRVSGVLQSNSPEAIWNQWFASERQSTISYRIQFPPASGNKDDFGVSGNAGLLGPERTRSSSEAEAAFERAVSDALMWELVNDDLQCENGVYPIVLVQGPMIPKLRGRLYYRMLDCALPLFFVTFQPEWLKQVPRSLRPVAEKDPSGAHAEVSWLGPVPALSIDEPGRYFLGFSDGDLRYKVELPANTLEPKFADDHWAKIKETCAALFSGQWQPNSDAQGLSSEPRLASLPTPLASAALRSLQRLNWDYDAELAFVVWQALGRKHERYSGERMSPSSTSESSKRQKMTPMKWVQEVDQLLPFKTLGTSGPKAIVRSDISREVFLKSIYTADLNTVKRLLKGIPNFV